jgi:hypothetical protein
VVDNVEPSTQKGAEKESVSQGRFFEILMVLLKGEKLLEVNTLLLFKLRYLERGYLLNNWLF